MPKRSRSLSFVILLIVTSFMLTGCWHWRGYNSNDDIETGNTSRTFAFSDSQPYEKGAQIEDKLVDKNYSLYIYIVNNGGHEKDKKTSAENVKLTLIDESNLKSVDLNTGSISEGVGYIKVTNLISDSTGRFHFHVEGNIIKNNKSEFVAVNSNSFRIDNPPSIVQSITVTPNNSSVQIGLTKTFTAIATHLDGKTTDVTEDVTWTSSNSKATILNNIATGEATGECNIKASLDGKYGITKLTIVPLELHSILITPINASIKVGETKQFTAKGIYSNGSSEPIDTANWSSSNGNIEIDSNGVATGIAAGVSTITGSFNSILGTADLTVELEPTEPTEPGTGGSTNRLIWENEVIID